MTNQRSTRIDACPSDESLTAYLTASLSPDENHAVDSHARQCDDCARVLQTVSARLRLADEIAMPIPFDVRQRATVATAAPVRAAASAGTWRDLIGYVTALLRPPVFLPLAAAAALLLFIGTETRQSEPVRSVPPIEQQTTLRIAAREVLVRDQPTTRGSVLATLNRGATVTYRGEDRDWLRVALADGSEGWIEREALDR